MACYFYDLRAQNPDKNLDRFYKISTGKNLFGEWTVILDYGRRGTQGRRRSHAFVTQEEARIFMTQKLKTRLAFRKHRGCAYRVVEAFYSSAEEKEGFPILDSSQLDRAAVGSF